MPDFPNRCIVKLPSLPFYIPTSRDIAELFSWHNHIRSRDVHAYFNLVPDAMKFH